MSALLNQQQRSEWVFLMDKIAKPVLRYGAIGQLKEHLPKYTPRGSTGGGVSVAHFEAAARTLAGIAPWLEQNSVSTAEIELQQTYRELARVMLKSIFDPGSSDYVDIQSNPQCLVEAAHIVLAIMRAPTQLWAALEDNSKKNIIEGLLSARKIKPFLNNWILFSGIVEAFLYNRFGRGDLNRVYWILQKMNSWYVGDGCYKDGLNFHFDYYNSIVIHPMMLNIIKLLPENLKTDTFKKTVIHRAKRYGALLERMISPEGAMPPIGRSLSYRTGVLHLLAELSLGNMLPELLKPENVQLAMSSVMCRHFGHEETWDANGWLAVGSVGRQESLAEFYISRGSLYMALAVFLPLGLTEEHDFWSGGDSFSSRSFYSGVDQLPDCFHK